MTFEPPRRPIDAPACWTRQFPHSVSTIGFVGCGQYQNFQPHQCVGCMRRIYMEPLDVVDAVEDVWKWENLGVPADVLRVQQSWTYRWSHLLR